MQYTLLVAAAALAQAYENVHGRHHAQRDLETVVNVEYVTVTQIVTAGAASSADASPTAQVKWGHGHGNHHWGGGYASSDEASVSSTTDASPSSMVASEDPSSKDSYAAPTTSEFTSMSIPAQTSSSVEVSPEQESSSNKPTTTFATSVSSAASPSQYSTATAPDSYGSSTTSSSPASGTGITANNLTPSGKKAGLSGYIGIQETQSFTDLAPYSSWYSDYAPDTPDSQGVQGIGMLWGASGSACGDVVPERLSLFNSMMDNDTTPQIMFGFYEPDCDCDMSSQMSVSSAQTQWDALLAPLAEKGVVLGSPSMCKQKDEDFLTPFKDNGARDWDVTSIHINKPDLDGVKEDVEYYVSTYGKPIWVTEFACVDDDAGWAPCTDQSQINSFINDAVSYFEGNENVVAYGPSVRADFQNERNQQLIICRMVRVWETSGLSLPMVSSPNRARLT